MTTHEQLPEGESTAKWAMQQPDFMGTSKQLTHCARCGNELPAKSYNEPRHFFHALKPSSHCLCDDCYDQLPD